MSEELIALDELLIFHHFKKMKNAPTKTKKSTAEHREIMSMVLRVNFSCSRMREAVIGRKPPVSLGRGLLPIRYPGGSADGIPGYQLHQSHAVT